MRVHTALVVVWIVLVGQGGCARSDSRDEEHTASSPAPAAPSESAEPRADGVDEAAPRVSLEAGSHVALAVETLTSVEGSAELKAFGRVLDPVPLVDAALSRTAAQSALASARAEHARVEALHVRDQNASRRDLEGARTALDRAATDAATATARCTLAWGVAADHADLDRVADELAHGRAAVARIDLPAGAPAVAEPAVVALTAVGDADHPLAARLLGRAPTTDPQLQGQGYLLLFETEPPTPGTALVATLGGSMPVRSGASVPRAAILWQEGRPFVYVAVAPDVFERRAITAPVMGAEAWIVTAGVAPGDRVVVEGAQQLLSAELLGGQPAD